uniref:Unique cartilage matrix-associated protein n=1 Tax=Oreochromis aureus TaxID=47969 RepID=A0AAZ1XAR5_OREAU
MSWSYATLLALLTVLFALSWSPEASSAAVPGSTGSTKDPQGSLKRVFMKQADASNFFRRRSRRGVKSQDELDAAVFFCTVRSVQLHASALLLPISSIFPADRKALVTQITTCYNKAEQRQILAADERKREFHEEKRNEFESYAEEEHDEQDERSRESTEQWREFHYDGMHPAYEYNRHST